MSLLLCVHMIEASLTALNRGPLKKFLLYLYSFLVLCP